MAESTPSKLTRRDVEKFLEGQRFVPVECARALQALLRAADACDGRCHAWAQKTIDDFHRDFPGLKEDGHA